ncbi:Unknown protein, partial [Striga hermonthica]
LPHATPQATASQPHASPRQRTHAHAESHGRARESLIRGKLPSTFDRENLKIVLQSEKREHVLDKSPPPPPEDRTSDEYGEYLRQTDDNLQARCYMLASMSNELQRQNELLDNASDILLHLQELYGERTRQIRYQISKEFFRCCMTESSSVHDHGLKMIALIERLSSLG